MAEIKSALELALEKAERYGKASPEEMAAAQYQEQGRHLAVKFLNGEGDLEAGLKNLSPQAQDVARIAIKEVFLRNIGLPRNGEADERLERAVAGLLLVAGSKNNMGRLTAELQQLLQQFQQFRNNAMQQLKARFTQSLPQMQRAMEAKTGQKMHLEVEQIPQFQEEWHRFHGQLLDQFEPMLEQLKERILQA
ncbi:MAG: hypothetical protein NTY36_08720 [Deltaproteobacteria bacterium]|nr:hypothetical protein [Deltaproteobacteria bacterium]